jgi:hypothetical protein
MKMKLEELPDGERVALEGYLVPTEDGDGTFAVYVIDTDGEKVWPLKGSSLGSRVCVSAAEHDKLLASTADYTTCC